MRINKKHTPIFLRKITPLFRGEFFKSPLERSTTLVGRCVSLEIKNTPRPENRDTPLFHLRQETTARQVRGEFCKSTLQPSSSQSFSYTLSFPSPCLGTEVEMKPRFVTLIRAMNRNLNCVPIYRDAGNSVPKQGLGNENKRNYIPNPPADSAIWHNYRRMGTRKKIE